MKDLSDTPHQGSLLALPTNVRQGWKSLPGTNTLAYWFHSQVTKKINYVIMIDIDYRNLLA